MKRGTSGGECYGWWSASTGTGGGVGYANACVHSGSNDYTGGNTVWYNYTSATAGTITETGNVATATESLCPKGWSLPTAIQIHDIGPDATGSTAYVGSFSPVYGGRYENGILYAGSDRGYWYSSEFYDGQSRQTLLYYYDESILSGALTGTRGGRYAGFYIRCVSEEKDVSDLTYMQDMMLSLDG